jgi:hypothetical protein
MKRLLIFIIVIGMFACEPRQGKSVEETPTGQTSMHEVTIQEVLQARNYTYIRASEEGKDIWMAILRNDSVEVGKTYYYDEAMEMKDFKSKDLDRTFASIYFLGGLSDDPAVSPRPPQNMAPKADTPQKTDADKRQDITIQFDEGMSSIRELNAQKAELEGKRVKVRGVVTKFNPNIMNKNWIHIQDGTGDESVFDLTITTLDQVKVGSVVTFEGTVAIDKDFGHGYKYDLLLEDATQLDKKAEIKVN